MEAVLHTINKYVSLQNEDTSRNNIILQQVLDWIINRMQKVSALFKELFREKYYGGSYYKGLKVGKPNEYDIDLLLILPKCNCLSEFGCSCYKFGHSNEPGYVWMKIANTSNKEFSDKFVEPKSEYLNTSKVHSWMQGIVQLALNVGGVRRGSQYLIYIDDGQFLISFSQSGPAITLRVCENNGKILMDIDLVPCFLLNKWPSNGFEKNTTTEEDVFIVPNVNDDFNPSTRYWRMSFQKQERWLMKNLNCFKPTIRLLKKLRDTEKHCIKSYYINTVGLWEIQNQSTTFWNGSLSNVFMTVLRKYQQCLEKKEIQYFWYKKKNMIGNVGEQTCDNISNRLKRIISDIEKNPSDPFVVARYLLTRSEYDLLMRVDSEDSEDIIEDANKANNSNCIFL